VDAARRRAPDRRLEDRSARPARSGIASMTRHAGRRGLLVAVACAPSLLVLAAAGPSSSPTPVSAVRPVLPERVWLHLDTPYFTLLGQVPEARLRSIGRRLEAYRAALEWLHPGAQSSPRETSVYVFRDAASGRPYSPPLADTGHHLGINPPYDVPNYVTAAAPVDDPPLDLFSPMPGRSTPAMQKCIFRRRCG